MNKDVEIMMSSRIACAVLFLCCLCGPMPIAAQTTAAPLAMAPDVLPGSDANPKSDAPPELSAFPTATPQAENEQEPSPRAAAPDEACSLREIGHDTWREASHFGRGLKALPRNMIRPKNLLWELPIVAVTELLIAEADAPASRRIQSKDLQQTAGRWSNVGLGLEMGSAALAYAVGCGQHNSYLRDTGFKAMAAMGAASASVLVLKLAFNREFPTKPGAAGEFWNGGRAFPSGHSATSFAFAAVIAHRYPQNKWAKWGAYALAAGVSLSRYPAKKHYLSDILMGATIGYVTGTYLAGH
jgi:membrane-associated phospholipid phosphatase